jgi:hypothetical protein
MYVKCVFLLWAGWIEELATAFFAEMTQSWAKLRRRAAGFGRPFGNWASAISR